MEQAPAAPTQQSTMMPNPYANMTEAELDLAIPLTNRILKDIWAKMFAFEHRFEQRAEEFEAENEALAARNNQLRILLRDNALLQRDTPVVDPTPKTAKVPDPPIFDGANKKDIIKWASKCEMKFDGQPSLFPTERSKIQFAGNFLDGPPLTWFTPLLKRLKAADTPDELKTFETMVDALKVLYGEHNIEEAAAESLHSLQQTSTVPKYISKFEEFRQYVDYTDTALRNMFYRGLKDWIKDTIANSGTTRPTTLQAMKTFALDIDARNDARNQEKKINSKPTTTTTTTTTVPFRATNAWPNSNSSRFPANAFNFTSRPPFKVQVKNLPLHRLLGSA
jgi:hypothetical protein